jgi:hypothetical protein
LTLGAYKLARFYSCHPNAFLELPISELKRHLKRTDDLLALIEEERQEQERP